MFMSFRSLGLTLAIACAVSVGCSSQPKAPPRDDLLAQLQQEAQALKAENENQDTNLGVSTTWTVTSVDVAEQPNNEKAPWKGTIVFHIKSETADTGGKVDVHEFDKEFHYTFNPTIQKWLIEYRP
jgi:hypothetical protein